MKLSNPKLNKFLIFFLYFKRELSELEKFLIFLQKAFFLYFREWNCLAPSLKNFMFFLKKISYISRGNFQSRKTKKIRSEKSSLHLSG